MNFKLVVNHHFFLSTVVNKPELGFRILYAPFLFCHSPKVIRTVHAHTLTHDYILVKIFMLSTLI